MDIGAATPMTTRTFGGARASKLASLGVLAVCVLGAAYLWHRASAVGAWFPGWRGDFNVYYELAYAMRTGLDPYWVNLNAVGRYLGFTPIVEHSGDSPTFVLCFVPLTLLSPSSAYRVWAGANVAALLASAVLLFGPGTGIGWRRSLPLMALAATFTPVADNLVYAQTSVFVLLGMIILMRLLARRRDIAAGAVLAALGLLRIFPLVMGGYLLARRRWRAVAALAASFAVGGALTAVLMGRANLLGFAEITLHMMDTGRWPGAVVQWSTLSPMNVSFDTFLARIFHWFAGASVPASLTLAKHGIAAAAKLALLALTFGATISGEDRDGGRAFSLWIVTMLLLSPMVWLHYLVLLLIPYSQITIARIHGRIRSRTWHATIVSYCFVFLTIPAIFHITGSIAGAFSFWSEAGFLSLLSAYVATYLFAVEEPHPGAARAEAPSLAWHIAGL